MSSVCSLTLAFYCYTFNLHCKNHKVEFSCEGHLAFCWGNQGSANFRVSLQTYVTPAWLYRRWQKRPSVSLHPLSLSLSPCRTDSPGDGHIAAWGQWECDGGVDRERRHQRERGTAEPQPPTSCPPECFSALVIYSPSPQCVWKVSQWNKLWFKHVNSVNKNSVICAHTAEVSFYLKVIYKCPLPKLPENI